MNMKIPDKYASGSEPLDSNRETLARALLEFIAESADEIIEEKDFCANMGLDTIVEKEKERMGLEILMLYLFFTSQWIINHYKMNGTELLDRVFFLASTFSDSDWFFWDIVEERYGAYYKAIRNTVGGGPMYWLGKEATLRILGMDGKDVDVGTMLSGTLFISGRLVGVTKGVEAMVDMSSESMKKVLHNKSLWKKILSFLGYRG